MDKISSDSSEPLLGDSNEPVVLAPQESIWRRLRRQWALLVVMALLLYNAILVTLNALHKHPELDPPYCRYKDQRKILLAQNVPAPANSIIKHERHRLWDGQPTIYAESPSAEVDAAWEDLLTGI